MKYVAEFEAVSKEQFIKDFTKLFAFSEVSPSEAYDNVILPKRATTGSAGYDFVSPFGFTLNKGESIVIPTGIRCKIDESWFLQIVPRSGLGFKFHVTMANTVGIIDSDYYDSDNEGHIMVKLIADEPFEIKTGDRFAQGIFMEYGIAVNDDATAKRNGGFGSSGK